MPAAQDAFSSLCAPLTFSEYCSAPWQVSPEQACCGICPSPAINAYGTIAGLIINSFFNLLIVLFQPAQSALYIVAQLMLGSMYIFAVLVRNWMGTVSKGTNGLQRWHAEFAFLLASSTSGLIVACLLSDVHHLHGFGQKEALHDWQTKKAILRQVKRGTNTADAPKHPLLRNSQDSGWQRLRKFLHRRQALLLFLTFTGIEIFWFVSYAMTVWWGTTTIFWQSNCTDLIGPSNTSLMTGTTFLFTSISLVSSALMAIPVFSSVSAAEFLVRLFHLHDRSPLHPDSSLRLRLKVQSLIKQGKLPERNILTLIHVETKAERNVKISVSLVTWAIWFVLVIVIMLRALDEFLLVGTAWTYAAIQNLIFGCFPAIAFMIKPLREHLSAQRKLKRLAASRPPVPSLNPLEIRSSPNRPNSSIDHPPYLPSLDFSRRDSMISHHSGTLQSTHQSVHPVNDSSSSSNDDSDIERTPVLSRRAASRSSSTRTPRSIAETSVRSRGQE